MDMGALRLHMSEHGPHVGWKFFELGVQWV